MAETFDLTDPVVRPSPDPITKYRVIRFFINQTTNESRLTIAVRDNVGGVIEAQYLGPAADVLISALNTANLSTKSLQKRVLERMAVDGFLLAGSVSGTPD
jgi:hypothetical protein